MSNLVFDVGRGLVIAGALFLFVLGILVLALLVSLRKQILRRDAENAAFERGMSQAEARKIEEAALKQANIVPPGKVIETVVYEKYPRMGPRAARRR